MPHFDGVDFTFDPTSRIYDWLVVYEDLMFLEGERLSNRIEPLACARPPIKLFRLPLYAGIMGVP